MYGFWRVFSHTIVKRCWSNHIINHLWAIKKTTTKNWKDEHHEPHKKTKGWTQGLAKGMLYMLQCIHLVFNRIGCWLLDVRRQIFHAYSWAIIVLYWWDMVTRNAYLLYVIIMYSHAANKHILKSCIRFHFQMYLEGPCSPKNRRTLNIITWWTTQLKLDIDISLY